MITKFFSHWMVMVKTSDGSFYLISTSPKHFVEIINPNYDGYTKDNLYVYQSKEYFYSIVKKYKKINNPVNVLEYAHAIVDEYIKRGDYGLFSTNCQYLTSYGLKNVLKVNCKNELNIYYDKLRILNELWRKRHDFINVDEC